MRSHRPHNSREPCYQLVSSDGDRQRAIWERFTRWIKEAIHIQKEGQQAMNRDAYGAIEICLLLLFSASVARVWRYRNLFIIITITMSVATEPRIQLLS